MSRSLRWAAISLGCVSAMYDVVIPVPGRALPPVGCPQGCALWSNLLADGNTRDQAVVNAKFRNGTSPATRSCAMPAYDPGESGPGWCYCRGLNNSDWGYCGDPAGSIPEQINLQFVSDSSLTIAFVTVDGHAHASPVARLSTDPGLAGAVTLRGITNYWFQDAADPREYSFHFVSATGLLPGTTYYYSVNSGVVDGADSNTYSFTTRDTAAAGRSLTFGVFGDMGIYAWNNLDLLAADQDIAFHLHLGDHAYQMSSDGGMRGDGYMIAYEGVLATQPWLTVMGNHEYYNDALFMRYLNQTAGVASSPPRTSSNSPTHNGRWYSVNTGPLHLVVLDFNPYYGLEGGTAQAEQLAWLETDLAAVDRQATPWLIAAAHMPMQCSSITYDGAFVDARLAARVAAGEDPADVAASAPYQGCTGSGVAAVTATRRDFEPLFLKYGVDLHLCGHEHNYESTWPSVNEVVTAKSFNSPAAPIYVVEGAGGAPALDLFGGAAPFTRLQDSSWGWGKITIHNDTHLTYSRVVNDRCKDSCQSAQCPPCPHPAGYISDTWTVVQPSHGPFRVAPQTALA